MDQNNVVVSPEARLSECPSRHITLAIPGPLSERLDKLVELADMEGARTNRSELLASLLLAAPEEAADLADAVIAFRKARARDAAVSGDLAAVLQLSRHQPGPRRKARSGR